MLFTAEGNADTAGDTLGGFSLTGAGGPVDGAGRGAARLGGGGTTEAGGCKAEPVGDWAIMDCIEPGLNCAKDGGAELAVEL